jgi:site-specific recombinase XerD
LLRRPTRQRVVRAAAAQGGIPSLTEPKTKESYRTLRMPQSTAALLREHKVRQNREQLLAGSRWQGSGFVFTTRHGGALRSRATTQRLQRKLAEAEVPRVTFHSLRHACASYLIAEGVPARVVQEVLGLSDIDGAGYLQPRP